MSDKSRVTVRADIKRNRLYITLSSDPNKTVLEKAYTDVRFCVADLKPGFDVITDLSQCSIGHLNSIPILRKIMDYLVTNQVGQVVRVIGKKSLLFKQFVRLATIFQSYSPAYVDTIEAAEVNLTNSARRNGLRFRLHQHQAKYRINQEQGKGQIIDISVSGCAVQAATLPLTRDKEISLSIALHRDLDTPLSFTIAGKVVRTKDDTFAVQFLDLDDGQKEELYECLACEARREVPQP